MAGLNKTGVTAVIAAVIGGVVGSLFVGFVTHADDAAPSIRAKEVVLVDGNNSPAARLGFADGSAVLQFYKADSTVALEIGTDRSSKFTFLKLYGEKTKTVAVLSTDAHGYTALGLGDQNWEGRVILGAITSDIPSKAPPDLWGLVLRGPGSVATPLSIGVGGAPPSAQIVITRPDGKPWIAP